MPVYNVEKYITECMDSIVSQETRWSFLVTVVNDGSPDRSRELLRKYESLPNVQIIDQENRGHSGARNTALKHIRGEYVMFVDSDDSLRPGAVEALMNVAKEHNCDIVQGSFHSFRGNTILQQWPYKDEVFTGFLTTFIWGKVYRAELFTNFQLPEGYWLEDQVFPFLVYEQATLTRTISPIVYNYRRPYTNISYSSKGQAKCLDMFYVIKRVLKDCRELNLLDRHNIYEKFLIEIEPIFIITLSIPNRNVWYEVFWQLVALKEEFFPDSHTERDYEQPLEDALVARDYKAYLRAILNILCPAPK